MKPAVFLYGVPGQYGNYAAALEAAGARVVLCRDLYRSLDCDGLLLPGSGPRLSPPPGSSSPTQSRLRHRSRHSTTPAPAASPAAA